MSGSVLKVSGKGQGLKSELGSGLEVGIRVRVESRRKRSGLHSCHRGLL